MVSIFAIMLDTKLIMLLYILLTVWNIEQLILYNNCFNVNKFSKKHILDKKYRCIRYFDENKYDKFSEKKCENFKFDYLNFQLGRSISIYSILKNNALILLLCTFVVFL